MSEEMKGILSEIEDYSKSEYLQPCCELTNEECEILLNYITNLQKENLALARENEQEKQFIKDCGFENTQQLALEYISLREEKENFRKLKERYQLEKEIYKSRNEKAVEYNKKIVEKYLKEDGCEYCDGRYNVAKKNLDILEGGDE